MPDESDVMLARTYALEALLTDGEHHKQWFLEKILIALGTDMERLKKELGEIGQEWDEGVAP